MCKECQYCMESCYWHLIEKRFCYDESIALYEEPRKAEKYMNAFENMAFYDQVSLIAGRAIVTIDPLPPKPIEHQPLRRIRWWEDNVNEQNKENEAKNKHNQLTMNKSNSITTIVESSKEDIASTMDELDSIINEFSITVDESEELPKPSQEEASIEDLKIDSGQTPSPMPKNKSLGLLAVDESVTLRKKSLRERRMSRSLTINITRNLELPIIRQISMPKFYIDTPEPNQLDSSVLMAPCKILASPVIPSSNQTDFFDLRSVVQLENEHRATQPVPVHKQLSPSQSRLSLIKEKLKSTKLKRQSSVTNLPNSVQHI